MVDKVVKSKSVDRMGWLGEWSGVKNFEKSHIYKDGVCKVDKRTDWDLSKLPNGKALHRIS